MSSITLLSTRSPIQPNVHPRPSVDEGVHAFKCPGRGDIRSVCPALNTLANHSYIPHDGRNISFSVLSRALQAGYGISPAFAQFLVLGGYILLRRNVLNPLDLHEIGLHNRIEHNASVVHADDVNGSKLAPTHVDPVLLHKFLTKAYSPPSLRSSEGDRVVTIQDIAYTRTAREIEAIVPPDAIHAEIARGEFAMVLDIFGRDPEKTLSGKDLGMWLNENRFPPGWAPAHQEGLLDTISESKKMRTLMDAYRGEEYQGLMSEIGTSLNHQSEGVHSLFSAIGRTMEDLAGKLETSTHMHQKP